MEIYPGISMDPGIRFGKPCLAGTRLDVSTVVAAVAAGKAFEVVEREYRIRPGAGPRRLPLPRHTSRPTRRPPWPRRRVEGMKR